METGGIGPPVSCSPPHSLSNPMRYLDAMPSPGSARPHAAGPAPTLVLLHAFPLNARMWEPQLELRDLGWRIIAPQLRGFDDDDRGGATSMDDYAGDVIDLLDEL